MKNIIYLLAFVAVLFVSCDPLDDVYEELDALSSDVVVGETALTLTDDDYDDLGLNFGNFNSTDQAKSLIPGLLTDKFPVWGKGSLAEVTYELYAPKQEQDSIVRYTVTTEDYDSNPETERFDKF